jgi:CheY-like chemotaxis protein
MARDQTVAVVVVDDDEGHTELVRRNLLRAGLRNPVVALRTGVEVLDYVLGRGPNAPGRTQRELVILLDINMPGRFDGIEVLRQLKSNVTTRHIPVVMLTTADDQRDVQRCYELGCNVYITKPVEPAAMVEAVRRLGMLVTIARFPVLREVQR